MMDRDDLSALSKSIARMMREYVAAAIGVVTSRLDQVEWRIKAIPAGPRGEKGEPGEPGESIVGPAGPKGEPGESIVGSPGKDGRDGREGKDGLNGRDALQIDILPAIDQEKSYPRGTFAKHDGGLIRAFRNTDQFTEDFKAAGWEVVFSGLSVFEVRQDTDPRVFVFLTAKTGELPSTMQVFIPAMIYREIYREGIEYERGDVVTFGGSAWHCQEKTTTKPGSGGGWKLMVKEGRAGKDGKDGERGPEGRAGKDR